MKRKKSFYYGRSLYYTVPKGEHFLYGRSLYKIVIERAKENLSAYVPDLPGCVTTGRTRREVLANMHKAIGLHLEGIAEDAATPPVAH